MKLCASKGLKCTLTFLARWAILAPLQFVGSFPENSEVDAQAELAIVNLQNFKIIMTARQILDGEQEKDLALHDRMVTLLTSQEQIDYFTENLEERNVCNMIWAAFAIILEPPFNALSQDLQIELNCLAENFINLPINLDCFKRCQVFNLEASSFIAHIAPKLIKDIRSDFTRLTTFRCLIGVKNCDANAFMRSWVKEYGLEHPLIPQLINLVPRIARLISLAHSIAYAKHIQKNSLDDGVYSYPRSEEIDYEVCQRENPEIEAAWLNLQSDFVKGKISAFSIVDALDWIPDVLIQQIQQLPD